MLDREKVLEWIEDNRFHTATGCEVISFKALKQSITNGDLDVKEEK